MYVFVHVLNQINIRLHYYIYPKNIRLKELCERDRIQKEKYVPRVFSLSSEHQNGIYTKIFSIIA